MNYIFLTAIFIYSCTAFATPYIGVQVGKSWSDFLCNEECDDETYGLGLLFGYQYNKYWALEANANYFGKIEIKDGQNYNTSDIWMLGLAPKLKVELNKDIDIYTKLGITAYQFKNVNQYSYFGSVGIDVRFTPNISLDIGYQTVPDIDIYNSNHGVLNSVNLGIIYKLPTSKNITDPIPERELFIKPQPIKTHLFSKTKRVVNYQNNSSDIDAEDHIKLDYIVSILLAHTNAKVILRGYADSVGREKYNLKLSKRRVEVLKDILLDKGIEDNKVKIEYYGEDKPVDSNKTLEGRHRNRRVEIVIPELQYKL